MIRPIVSELGVPWGGMNYPGRLHFSKEPLNYGSKMLMPASKIETTNESLKSVWLDAITHDFITPLTSIKASVTGLLGDLEFDREQWKELLTIIDEECDRIDQLVREAAEIARLESGEVKLDLESHSVGELVSAALADCRSVTSSRKICLDVPSQDSRFRVDLSLAKRVLVHLITNAHLYSSPGQPIKITTEERGGFHTVSVADEGRGIEAEEIDRIFEKCYRGRNQRYRVQGTGMGLPIAKAIVEAHGGTLRVQPGGTRVHLYLHLADRGTIGYFCQRPNNMFRLFLAVLLASVLGGRSARVMAAKL